MTAFDLDKKLRAGNVCADSFKQLEDAEIYGTATPMQWLEKRLRLIAKVARSEHVINFDTGRESGEFQGIEEFNNWCQKYFPDAYACFFA